MRRALSCCLLLALLSALAREDEARAADQPVGSSRLLYVASPGVRDYVKWGGHGVLVFDIDGGHRFVKRLSLEGYGVNSEGKVLNVKGVCASATTGRLYVSTLQQLICLDLATDRVLWQRTFDLECETHFDF